jgi:hypothetical protein
MREIRSSGSVEGVMSNHDPYSDFNVNVLARDEPDRPGPVVVVKLRRRALPVVEVGHL